MGDLVRIMVFRKVKGPPATCHVSYEDVAPSEAYPMGTRIITYLGGAADGAEAIEKGHRLYQGCRVACLSRGDTLVEVWEDPTNVQPTRFRNAYIAGYRYTLHSSIQDVLRQGRSTPNN